MSQITSDDQRIILIEGSGEAAVMGSLMEVQNADLVIDSRKVVIKDRYGVAERQATDAELRAAVRV